MTSPYTVLTNDLQGKQLGKVVSTSVQGGHSSPFPSDAVAPTPSANVTVADPNAREYVYLTGDAASVTFTEPENIVAVREAFVGSIASAQKGSASNLAQVTIDHKSSNLNQEVVTRPLMSTGFDFGQGSWLLQGAFTQFAAECGLFEDGVKGNVLLGITNRVPGIGYYRHASKRFVGAEFGAGNGDTIQWVPTESAVVDNGISLGLNESLSLVVGISDFIYWDGTSEFTGTLGVAASTDSGPQPSWVWVYTPLTGTFSLVERVPGVGSKIVFDRVVGAYTNRPLFFEVKVTRTTATNLKYDLSFVFEEITLPVTATFTVTNSYMPTMLAPTVVELTGYRGDEFAVVQSITGYRSCYITKDGAANDITSWLEQGVRLSINTANDPTWDFSVVPGVAGNAWQLVHDMAAAYGLIFNPLTFTLSNPGEGVSGEGYTPVTNALNISAQARDLAETVEVVNYDYRHSPDVFNPIQLHKADTAYSLAVGERQEHIVQTDSSFSMLYQPRCVTYQTALAAYVNPDIGESLYSVFDSGNLPLIPAQWNNGGGFITVEGTGTPGEMKLIIQAPTDPDVTANWPLTITLETTIPSLIISGIGAVARKKTITSYTGAGQGINIKRIGTTYDNPMVSKDNMAWEVAAKLGHLYGTTPTTINVNLPDNTLGNLEAPRVLHEGAVYLPTQWSQQGNSVSLSNAIRYTSCAEMNIDYAGMTNAQYNAMYAGKNIRYVNISPLQFRSA